FEEEKLIEPVCFDFALQLLPCLPKRIVIAQSIFSAPMIPGNTAVCVFQGTKERVIIKPYGSFLRKGQKLCAKFCICCAFEISKGFFKQRVLIGNDTAIINTFNRKRSR